MARKAQKMTFTNHSTSADYATIAAPESETGYVDARENQHRSESLQPPVRKHEISHHFYRRNVPHVPGGPVAKLNERIRQIAAET
ncbi:MAG: hypothetical protein P8Y61_09920 [Gammaproteobacteria bacterium]